MRRSNQLVSVVITCYNYGEFLKDSIDSVIKQTYKNIEIWIIDDGSTDNTKVVAEEYKNTDNLHYVYQDNHGVASARNLGIDKSTGDYLVFLDADDKFMPNFIKEHVACLENDRDVDYAYSLMKTFGRSEEGVADILQFDPDLLKQRNYIHASALFRTKIIKKYQYDVRLKALEDWDLYLSLLEDGHIGKLIPKPLLLYRKHDALISRSDTILDAESQVNINYCIFKKHPALYPKGYALKYLIGSKIQLYKQKAKLMVKKIW